MFSRIFISFRSFLSEIENIFINFVSFTVCISAHTVKIMGLYLFFWGSKSTAPIFIVLTVSHTLSDSFWWNIRFSDIFQHILKTFNSIRQLFSYFHRFLLLLTFFSLRRPVLSIFLIFSMLKLANTVPSGLLTSTIRNVRTLAPTVNPAEQQQVQAVLPDKLYSSIEIEYRGHDKAVLKSYTTFLQVNILNFK